MIRAVIFDFGNVLCTFDNNIFLGKLSRNCGKTIEELRKIIYVKSNAAKKIETSEITEEQFFETVTKICGLTMSKEEFYIAFTHIFTEIPGTYEIVKKLKKNYKLAVMSNTTKQDFEYNLKPLEVFPLFDAVTLSFKVGVMKPDERIYRDTLEKLNLKPDECVYIDDRKDFAGKATKLGMKGIIFTSPKQLENDLRALGIKL